LAGWLVRSFIHSFVRSFIDSVFLLSACMVQTLLGKTNTIRKCVTHHSLNKLPATAYRCLAIIQLQLSHYSNWKNTIS